MNIYVLTRTVWGRTGIQLVSPIHLKAAKAREKVEAALEADIAHYLADPAQKWRRGFNTFTRHDDLYSTSGDEQRIKYRIIAVEFEE